MICHFCESVDSGDYESCIDCAKDMAQVMIDYGIVEYAKETNFRKRKMPTKVSIKNYWDMIFHSDIDGCVVPYWEGTPWDGDYENRKKDNCFACNIGWLAGSVRVQRSHILPKCEGGTDKESNIHLLCTDCHKESEGLSGYDYFVWFFRMSLSLSFSRFFVQRFGFNLWNRMSKGDKSKETTEEIFIVLKRNIGVRKATEALMDRLEIKQGELF